jgi:hypothetical protein
MKKSGKLVYHVVNSNIAINTLPILTVFSNIGEDVQYSTVVSISVGKQLFISNDRHRVR